MDGIPAPLVGGLLLSFATSSLLIDQGRILGCSGVAHATQAASTKRLLSFFSPNSPSTRETGGKDESWKTASVLGLVAGGFALSRSQGPLELLVGQTIFDGVVPGLLGRPIMAGFTVGLGTKLARGCTSGHMLIGMARLSARSIAATCTFFPFAMITARLFPYALPLNMSATIATLNLAYLTPSLSLLFLLPIATSILAHRIFPNRLASLIQSFSLSFLFSLGLALTGMLRPSKVLSFFYVPLSSASSKSLPPWDPSLALVALGGLLPNMIAWRTLVRDRASPRKREKWEVPTGGKIDTRLLVGSAIFGIGWGLAGVCPGPLLAVLGSKTGGSALALFAGAFAVGGFVGDKVQL